MRSFPCSIQAYAAIARQRLDQDAFEDFCETHLGSLDEIAWNYFGSDRARQAVRLKVEALFPEHEWDEFTDLFWTAVQDWRDEDARTRTPAGARR